MENITLATEVIAIAKKHRFTVSEVQKKGAKYSVVFSLPISKEKTWDVAVSFDGTSEGLVKSMRTKLDSFPSNSGKYERFIDLYWDLWEVFGEDDDEEDIPVGMLSFDNILSMLS